MKLILDSSLHKVRMLTKDANQGLRDDMLNIYEQMFYIFRTKPQYLATLTRLVRGSM
jgi:hypothetical protein